MNVLGTDTFRVGGDLTVTGTLDLNDGGSRDSSAQALRTCSWSSAFASAAAAQSRAEFGDFYALVIGNNEYVKLPRLERSASTKQPGCPS